MMIRFMFELTRDHSGEIEVRSTTDGFRFQPGNDAGSCRLVVRLLQSLPARIP